MQHKKNCVNFFYSLISSISKSESKWLYNDFVILPKLNNIVSQSDSLLSSVKKLPLKTDIPQVLKNFVLVFQEIFLQAVGFSKRKKVEYCSRSVGAMPEETKI